MTAAVSKKGNSFASAPRNDIQAFLRGENKHVQERRGWGQVDLTVIGPNGKLLR